MKTLRTLLLLLVLGSAAVGAAAVAYFDPPAEARMIETPVTLPDR